MQRYQAGGAPLRRTWYVFMLGAVLFTPVPVLMHLIFGPYAPWYLAVDHPRRAGGRGAVLRAHPLAVPGATTLAELYGTRPCVSPATRDSVKVVFAAFHRGRTRGVAIGEHEDVFTSSWTVLVCVALLQTGLVHPLFGWVGLLTALGVFVGVFEEVGFKPAGAINATSYLLWSLWAMALGVAVLLLR